MAQVFPLSPVFTRSQTVISVRIHSFTVVRLFAIAKLLFVGVVSPISYCFQIHTQEGMTLDLNVLTLNVTRIFYLLLEYLWLKILYSFLRHIRRFWAKRSWGNWRKSSFTIFDLTSHTSGPFVLFNGNIKESSICIRGSSILASVSLFKQGWVLLKGVASLTHISDNVSKCDWLFVPVCHPKICGDWRKRWFEASHPVTISWELVVWFPALVPQTSHAEILKMAIACFELPCGSTFVTGGTKIKDLHRHSREIGHIVPRDICVLHR